MNTALRQCRTNVQKQNLEYIFHVPNNIHDLLLKLFSNVIH
ncbi:hypothetical protein HMPREF9444_01117 [Succinatimonas hippei YIT 12066]|uniref:Uncharacterized protein n=1 Tax=Succinatimonas hippei (strain DSM 22608 / JCM 16073 / KCTC 15190 / YIT 12066) TaxID=762983 RepID=E8LK80_SUCHY|nr:hypothetical protein HMPREF9444_01117 [Succinatimonas hippei YIT 12066]